MPRHSRLPARHSVRSSMLRWGAALGILVVLGVGVAELLLRSFPQHLPPATQFRLHDNAIKANEVHSLPDQELGYLWRPHVSERIEGFNFGFDYSTDAHGFRNQGPWPDWADVVVVGDSQAFGFGVDDGESWARQMAERLPGLAIVNLGLIGAAPQQFEKVYRAYGRKLRPEVVLVGLFPPHSMRMGQMFEQWQAEGKPDRFDLRRLHGAGGDGLLGEVKDRVTDSYAVLGLYYGLKSMLGGSDLHTMTFDDGQVRLASARYGDTAASAATGERDFVRVIDLLDQLQETVTADGAEMIVLPFPTKEEVHLPLLGERPHQLTAPLKRALERRGIAYLDLMPALRQAVEAGEHLFFEIDLHPNPAGHELIATTVSEELRRRFGARPLAALPDREPGALPRQLESP